MEIDNNFVLHAKHPLSKVFVDQYLDQSRCASERSPATVSGEERYFEEIGATVLAPFVTAFCVWLAESASRQNIRDLAFLARDGQFIKKVFDLLYPQGWSTTYVAASRRMTTLPFTRLDPETIANHFHRTLENSKSISEFFSKLKSSDSIRMDMRELGFDLDASLDRKSRKIFLKYLSENAESLRRTFDQEVLTTTSYYEMCFPADQKTGLVDLGWRGSLQSAILDCLGDSRKVVGFYFGTSEDAIEILERKNYVHEAFICRNGSDKYQADMLDRYRDLIEFLFSADHGSIYSVAERSEGFVWQKYDLSASELSNAQIAGRIQNGAFCAIETVLKRSSINDVSDLCRSYDAQDVWSYFQNPTRRDGIRFSKVRVFSGIGDNVGESLTRIGEGWSHYRNLKRSNWPEAYSTMLGRLSRIWVNVIRKSKNLPEI